MLSAATDFTANLPGGARYLTVTILRVFEVYRRSLVGQNEPPRTTSNWRRSRRCPPR
jgi:hypothetical protein